MIKNLMDKINAERKKTNIKIPKILKAYEDYLRSTIKRSNRIIFIWEDTKPWESKLGGCPYLENIEQYPKGTNGEPMMFLVQLNLVEMMPLPDFPQEGLLQFYAENDDCYGLCGRCVVKYITKYKTNEEVIVSENPYSDDYKKDLLSGNFFEVMYDWQCC